MAVNKSEAINRAELALASGHYDEAAAVAQVSMAVSADRLAQTAADLVDAFARYLVLTGHDEEGEFNGRGRKPDVEG